MSESLPAAVTEEIIPVDEVAARLSVPVSRVFQLVRDGQLLSLKHERDVVVPAVFLDGDDVVRGLSGTIMVLRDGGYDDADILRWLFTDDETLSGTPIAAIRAGRHKEIKRRAQAMAF
ncbi:Rv2175c family DNA-binding protein [Pseudonocardia phyllosphaerae]|uniref:Rv2175c family DNA-binding protein n=1 Tax=Pseudonocardia phyllosphaerae TaxID=3390502 RepID=UPI00397E3A56